MGNGNRPTPEVRRDALRQALTSGRTRREIAEDRPGSMASLVINAQRSDGRIPQARTSSLQFWDLPRTLAPTGIVIMIAAGHDMIHRERVTDGQLMNECTAPPI